jgi:hypothetical protein
MEYYNSYILHALNVKYRYIKEIDWKKLKGDNSYYDRIKNHIKTLSLVEIDKEELQEVISEIAQEKEWCYWAHLNKYFKEYLNQQYIKKSLLTHKELPSGWYEKKERELLLEYERVLGNL